MRRARAGNALPAPAASNPPLEGAAGMDPQSRGRPDMDKPDTSTADRANLPDHYAALRVNSSASQQEIARAYRALMRKLHPDVDGGSPARGPAEDSPAKQGRTEGNAGAQQNELLGIMQAFAVLRDPVRREAYDQAVAHLQASARPEAEPQSIPVRHARSRTSRPDHTIRITPVRWESGPWA
jgi:hypothetical protein